MEIPDWIKQKTPDFSTARKYSAEELIQRECDIHNSLDGNLGDIDCPICKNRGYIAVILNDNLHYKECKCMVKRKNIWRIKASGLSKLLDDYTFDRYKAVDNWQKKILEKAKVYAENPEGWFYIGGQVGSGKTHICTAIAGELMDKGLSAKYMLWRDEARTLKANVTEEIEYNKRMDDLKTCDVLYIDDFFKTDTGRTPTTGDINVAFELLNYRYNNRTITILSSERPASSLMDIDEAIASRIIQRCGDNIIDLGHDRARNYRLRRA